MQQILGRWPDLSRRTPMTFWRRLALLRVPIVFWLLYGPGLILMMQPGMSLSRGFADLTPAQFFFAAVALWSATAALAATVNLALLYGPRRIDWPVDPHVSSEAVAGVCFLPSLATVLFLVFTAPSLDPANRSVGLYTLLALLSALIVFAASAALIWIALRLAVPGARGGAVALILPMRWVPGARAAYAAKSPAEGLIAKLTHWLGGFVRWLGPGYADAQSGALLPGHVLAAFLVWGYLALYLIAGTTVIVHGSRGTEESGLASTLLFVVIIITLTAWVLGALAFFLDRFRIPLLSPFFLVLLVLAVMDRPDHFFPVKSVAALPQRPTPADTLLASRSGDRVVLIASAGGGIQAAAWTTTVMAHLEQREPHFHDMVRLMSGVSGGSVGLYYSLRIYPDSPAPPIPLDNLAKLGGESMLEAVAHGLAYPGRFDRGLALESLVGNIGANPWTLGDYAAQMRAKPGALPAVVLNATSVEDGAPVAFSTTALAAPGTGILDWLRSDGNTSSDVRLATAARLSATFPYVSPSPRAAGGKPSARHYGDGGYFDNYGLYAAMAWLEEALEDLPNDRLGRLEVLVLSIESFPDSADPQPVPQGPLWQGLAPMALLYNARTYSQRNRNTLEIGLFRNRFEAIYGLRPEQFRTTTVRYHTSPGCEANPPLSWHLTPIERACVEASWGAAQADLQPVISFIEGR
jgi:hypothetical protein